MMAICCTNKVQNIIMIITIQISLIMLNIYIFLFFCFVCLLFFFLTPFLESSKYLDAIKVVIITNLGQRQKSA